MRMAIIGFGGVGRALLKLLLDKKTELMNEGLDPKVNYIISSKWGVYDPKGIDIENFMNYYITNNDMNSYPLVYPQNITFGSLLENKDVDIVIEMTPTNIINGEPGMTHIIKSLECGFHVVTANKGPILLAYKKLKQIAINNKVQLCIGCTTGGALPSINSGIIDMAGSRINSIEGILNGTTNYIINEMESSGIEYAEALIKAQALGIAEADPSLDVDGWDTAAKLLILTNVLMNEEKTIDDMNIEGISAINLSDIQDAFIKGQKYKLIGRAVRKKDGLDISVMLEKVGLDNPLYGVDGRNKAVRYTSDTLGDLTIIGGASGLTAAAASILRDIINIKRGYNYMI